MHDNWHKTETWIPTQIRCGSTQPGRYNSNTPSYLHENTKSNGRVGNWHFRLTTVTNRMPLSINTCIYTGEWWLFAWTPIQFFCAGHVVTVSSHWPAWITLYSIWRSDTVLHVTCQPTARSSILNCEARISYFDMSQCIIYNLVACASVCIVDASYQLVLQSQLYTDPYGPRPG